MDSDLDVPLSNCAEMNYLRKEIARLEKLVVEKMARVQTSALSPAAAGHQSVPRILTASTIYSPAAATPSLAVEQREVRSLGRRSSSKRRASGASQTDVPERSSGRSETMAHKSEKRSSNRGRENEGRLREGDRSQRFEDRGTHRLARKTKPGGDPSSSDHSEDSFEESVVKRNSIKRNGRHSMGVKLGNYDGNTCL